MPSPGSVSGRRKSSKSLSSKPAPLAASSTDNSRSIDSLNVSHNQSIPLIRNLEEYDDFITNLGLGPSAREKSLLWFKQRLQADKQKMKGALQASKASKSKSQSSIFTPGFRLLESHEVPFFSRYEYPSHLIRSPVHRDYIQPIRLTNGDIINYDLTVEDLEFINTQLAPAFGEAHASVFLEENFMRLIHHFETHTGFGPPISASVAQQIAESLLTAAKYMPPTIVKQVHQYWLARREELQKPLLRRFWGPGPPNQPPAYVVFQARLRNARDRMALRRPRRNASDQSHRLEAVCSDLGHVEKILRLMIQRDKHKLLIAELNSCIFNQMRCEIQDPTYVSPQWNYLKTAKFAKYLAKSEDNEAAVRDKWIRSLAAIDREEAPAESVKTGEEGGKEKCVQLPVLPSNWNPTMNVLRRMSTIPNALTVHHVTPAGSSSSGQLKISLGPKNESPGSNLTILTTFATIFGEGSPMIGPPDLDYVTSKQRAIASPAPFRQLELLDSQIRTATDLRADR